MEIAATNPAAAVPQKSPEQGDASVIDSDFQTFLRMLTVQMQNQDPLNPVQSEDFAVQLATFSGVEQQVRTNDLLAGILSQTGMSGVSEFADWIGKQARAPAPVFFDGTPITVAPDPSADAGEAFLVARDTNGLEVQRVAIPVSDTLIEWDGATASGYPVMDGVYSFSVESWKDGDLISVSDAETYGTVREARLENGETMLVMEGGVEIAADSVSALRAP